jgi:hypothetical protein
MSGIVRFVSIPGVRGCLAGFLIFGVCYFLAWLSISRGDYLFHPPNRNSDGNKEPGYLSFEPILSRYQRLTEFMVGLATSSIVLLAGSSVFRSGGKLPKVYGSPLVLLAMSVVWAVLFIAWVSYNYEAWLHRGEYSHHRYRLSTALGFSGLLCFAVGYCWMGFALVSD